MSGPIGQKFNEGKLPYSTVLTKQFPLALKEVIKRSVKGHIKYIETDEDWMNFKRIENAEQQYFEAIGRHFFKEGDIDETELDHLTAVAWNTLALLEIKLEKLNNDNRK